MTSSTTAVPTATGTIPILGQPSHTETVTSNIPNVKDGEEAEIGNGNEMSSFLKPGYIQYEKS
ncbi:MAG: hypothetical protein U5J63_16310 [Fodinibius sp.]|nr:hypothetical protein [Fodinibius sp.]